MTKLFRHNDRLSGFTVLELLIVVAIIGILAAVAIPGFQRYLNESKTAEAHNTLNIVATGALAYYQSEHPLDNLGLHLFTSIYPGCEEAAAYQLPDPCDHVKNYSQTQTIGVRISPDDSNLTTLEPPWTRLNFSINKPFVYVISYTSDTNVDASSFEATATASLSAVDDSILTIKGSRGERGPVISNITVVK